MVLTLFGYQLSSAAVSQLLDYIVWERAAAHFPDPLGLTRFMGLFGVVINVVTIVFVAGFAGRLLTRFGVGVGLWANPAGVLVLLVVAVVAGSVGGLAGAGFFLAACAGQVVDIALTDGMTRTGISATYQVLPVELRLRAQTMIEGAGVPLALGFVGVLLLVFRAFSLSVLVVAVVTSILSLVWLLLARKAFLDYGRKLRLAVTSRPWDPRLLPIGDPASREALWRLLDSPEPAERGLGLRTLAEAADVDLPQHVAALLADPDPDRQALGVETAVRGGMADLSPAVLRVAGEPSRAGSVRAAAVGAHVRLGGPGAAGKLTGLLDDADPLVRAATAATQVDVDGAVGQRALGAWRLAVGSGGEQARWALSGAAASPSPRFLPDLIDLAATTAPPDDLAAVLAAHADLLVPELAASLTSTSPAGTLDHRTMDRVLRRGDPELVARGPGRPAALPELRPPVGRRIRRAGVGGGGPHRRLRPARPVGRSRGRPGRPRVRGAGGAGSAALAGSIGRRGIVDLASARSSPARRDRCDCNRCRPSHRRHPRPAHGQGGGRAGRRRRRRPGACPGSPRGHLGRRAGQVAVPLIDPTLDEERRRRLLVRFAPREVGDAGWWLRDLAFDDGRTWQEPWLLVCALYAAPVILGGRAVAFAQSWEDCDDWVVAETARWALAEAGRGQAEAKRGVRMSESVELQLDQARRAVRRRAWREAYELLAAADDAADGLRPDALEALGQAAWADGRFVEAERARERAFAGYSELDDRPAAARMALALASDQFRADTSRSRAGGWPRPVDCSPTNPNAPSTDDSTGSVGRCC